MQLLDPLGALGRRLAGRDGQRLQDGDGIGDERHRRAVVAPDLARIVVDVDERLTRHRRGRQRVALSRHLGQARADGDDQIGFEIALGGRFGNLEAEVSGIVGVRVGEVVLALEGECDREVMRLRRRSQRRAPPRRADTGAAGDQQRPLRLGDPRHDLGNRLRGGGPCPGHGQRLDHIGVRRLLQHVLGQHHHHRPRRRRLRLEEGAGNDLRHTRRIVDQVDGLGHVGESLGVVHLLERAPADLRARHLADEQHQRHGILLGHVHGNRRVGGAGTAADERHARPPRHLGIADRHEAGAALVTTDDGLDGIAVVQSVEDRQIALARHAEDAVDAVSGQAVDDEVGGATGHRALRG